TLSFGQSRRRWFGTCSCKPVPRGQPSSVEQLRTSSAFRPFAVLVAHCNRDLGNKNLRYEIYAAWFVLCDLCNKHSSQFLFPRAHRCPPIQTQCTVRFFVAGMAIDADGKTTWLWCATDQNPTFWFTDYASTEVRFVNPSALLVSNLCGQRFGSFCLITA